MRVVITGMVAVTPIGNSVEEFWKNVKLGKIGISKIENFDTSDFKVSLSAEIKDFDPSKYLDRKSIKRMDRFSQFGIVATKDAKLDIEHEDKYIQNN